MTRLRARVAERLKGAQNTYAMLTTFNEIDMTNLMQLRTDFKVRARQHSHAPSGVPLVPFSSSKVTCTVNESNRIMLLQLRISF